MSTVPLVKALAPPYQTGSAVPPGAYHSTSSQPSPSKSPTTGVYVPLTVTGRRQRGTARLPHPEEVRGQPGAYQSTSSGPPTRAAELSDERAASCR